jgi:predicted dinucleotide-binding enzyme
VKAFDTTFAIPLRAGEVVCHKLDVLIAGDDEDGRARSPQSPATAGSTRSTWAR